MAASHDRNRIWIIIVALLLAGALIAGCGTSKADTAVTTAASASTTDTTAASAATTLTAPADASAAPVGSTASGDLFEIRYPKLLFSDPVYIADAKGFFKEQGIKITFTGSLSGPDVVTSVATGSNDFAGTHASFITQGIAKGFKIKAVAAGWASTAANPVSAWLVLNDSPIKTPADLAGKKVALTSPKYYPWLELLAKNNIPKDKVTTVVLGLDKQEQALRSKQVDVISLLNPFLNKAVKTGGVRILLSTVDVVGEEKGWPQQFTSLEFIQKHPDVVKRFVTAIAEANDYAIANPTEAGKIFAKALGAPEEFAPYYAAAYPEHALVDDANAQLWLDFAVKYGDVKQGQLKTSDIYTNEFNPNATK